MRGGQSGGGAALQGQSERLNACRSATAARPVTSTTCGRDFAADNPKVPWKPRSVLCHRPTRRTWILIERTLAVI